MNSELMQTGTASAVVASDTIGQHEEDIPLYFVVKNTFIEARVVDGQASQERASCRTASAPPAVGLRRQARPAQSLELGAIQSAPRPAQLRLPLSNKRESSHCGSASQSDELWSEISANESEVEVMMQRRSPSKESSRTATTTATLSSFENEDEQVPGTCKAASHGSGLSAKIVALVARGESCDQPCAANINKLCGDICQGCLESPFDGPPQLFIHNGGCRRRACKGKRLRWQRFMDRCEADLLANPEAFDVFTLGIPQSLKDPCNEARLALWLMEKRFMALSGVQNS